MTCCEPFLLIYTFDFSIMEIEGPIQTMVSHGEPICITKAQGNTLNKLVIACENGNLLETKTGKLENWKKSAELTVGQKSLAKLSVTVQQNSNSNSDFGIKAMSSTWNSTQGTQIAILHQSFITGQHMVNLRDYDLNLTSSNLTLEARVDVTSLTFATHMNNLHLICLYPSKSFSGKSNLNLLDFNSDLVAGSQGGARGKPGRVKGESRGA